MNNMEFLKNLKISNYPKTVETKYEDKESKYSLSITKVENSIWHPNINFIIYYENTRIISFSISETKSGCGTVVFSNYSSALNKKLDTLVIEIIKYIFEQYKLNGAGTIITTLGESYWGYDQLLRNLGFKVVNEYINYRHGTSYKQRLMVRNYEDVEV